jgi:hypothetical protein
MSSLSDGVSYCVIYETKIINIILSLNYAVRSAQFYVSSRFKLQVDSILLVYT